MKTIHLYTNDKSVRGEKAKRFIGTRPRDDSHFCADHTSSRASRPIPMPGEPMLVRFLFLDRFDIR